MNNKAVIASVVGMVIVGVGFSLSLYQTMTKRPTFPEISVSGGIVSAVVSVDGKVVPENIAHLGFEQAGKVVTLPYAVGDVVKKGTVLVSVDATSANAQLRQEEALAKSATANLTQYQALTQKAKAQLDSLGKSDLANTADKRAQKRQVDATEAQVEAQKSQISAAQAGVDMAKYQVRKTMLTAPFDGIVTQQSLHIGEIAGQSESIITLSSQDISKVEVFVSQSQVQNIHMDDGAQVTLTTTPHTLKAHVIAIDPAETDINGISAYKITLHLDDTVESLRSGTQAHVEIVTESKKDALSIPEQSIFTSGGKTFVSLLSGGRTVQKEIVTGLRGNDGHVEIISGLQRGDSILGLNQ